MASEDLYDLFTVIGERLMNERNRTEFIIDKNNEEVIKQLCCYLTGDKDFQGDHYKGILLQGHIGTGKTLLMFIIREVYKYYGKVLDVKNAAQINSIWLGDSDSKKRLFNGILCLDDMGVEEPLLNSYGTKIRPIYEIVNIRDYNNRLTFITTNLGVKTIEERYGDRVLDRLTGSLNQLVLKGKSRRK